MHSIYKKKSVVRGHHIYQKSWRPVIEEPLTVEREEINQHDDYAVAVMKNKDIVGHAPRSVSRKYDEVEAVPHTIMTRPSFETRP